MTVHTKTAEKTAAKRPAAKPAAKPVPLAPTPARDVLVMAPEPDEALEPLDDDDDGSVEPEPDAAPCVFPLEATRGRCPVAVFNSPTSPNERLMRAAEDGGEMRFTRGTLAVFSEDDAQFVRTVNPGGVTYLEANPRWGDEPATCTACFPPTRWYSQEANQRHMRFAHAD